MHFYIIILHKLNVKIHIIKEQSSCEAGFQVFQLGFMSINIKVKLK